MQPTALELAAPPPVSFLGWELQGGIAMTLRRTALAAVLVASTISALPSSAEAWGWGRGWGWGGVGAGLAGWSSYRRCYRGFILRLRLSLLRVRIWISFLRVWIRLSFLRLRIWKLRILVCSALSVRLRSTLPALGTALLSALRICEVKGALAQSLRRSAAAVRRWDQLV